MTIIEIEGDLVRVVERSVVRQASLTDMMPFLETRPALTMFHPRTAIMTYWDESNPAAKKVLFLCESAPGLRAIVKGGRRYRLSMPWTYFMFGFETAGPITGPGSQWMMRDHRVFHTNQRVAHLNDRVWTAFLPNVYENGDICFGSTGAEMNQPLSDRVDTLVNTWYMTEFNNDVIGGRAHPLPFNARFPSPGFRPWVDATAEHGASAWTTFPEWNETNNASIPSFTIEDLLRNAGYQSRVAPRTFTDAIPPIPTPATFGRVEEWLNNDLTPLQRLQVARGLTNITNENPDALAPEADLPPAVQTMEDGGEPI